MDYKVITVDTDDAAVDCVVFGSGDRAFVIIPGISVKSVVLSASAVADAYSLFGEKYTVYLIDRRREISEGLTVKDFADDTAKVMKKLNIENADVFGASQGGMIAQLLALDYPELVRCVVLGSSASRLYPQAREVCEKWCVLAKQGKTELLVRDFINKVYSKSFSEKFGEMLVKMTGECTPDELSRFINCTKASESFDVTDRVKNIKRPVLVIGAENDGVLTGDASRETARLIGCVLYMYGEPYGHAVYDEAPDYKKRLTDFYDSI